MLVHAAGQPLGGIVDENVDLGLLIAEFLGGEGRLPRVGQIENKRLGPRAGPHPDRFRERRQTFGIAGGHDDTSALIGKHHREGGAETACSAGDHHGLPGEIGRSHSPLPLFRLEP